MPNTNNNSRTSSMGNILFYVFAKYLTKIKHQNTEIINPKEIISRKHRIIIQSITIANLVYLCSIS